MAFFYFNKIFFNYKEHNETVQVNGKYVHIFYEKSPLSILISIVNINITDF